MQGDKEKCIAAGMDGYISKPVHSEALEKLMIKWLEEKKELGKKALHDNERKRGI